MNVSEVTILLSTALILILPIRYLRSHLIKLRKSCFINLRPFSFFIKRFEQAYIAHEIESVINASLKTINSRTKTPLLPHCIKIRWVKGTDEKILTRNGTVIIRMRSCDSQAENLVKAIEAFLSTSLMPSFRHYIDKKVFRSVELALTKEILKNAKRDVELQYFTDRILKPEMECAPRVKDYYSSFACFDAGGFFFDILLGELAELEEKNRPMVPNRHILRETEEFTQFLIKIMTRKRSVDIPLTYEGTFIKTKVVLVGKSQTIKIFGAEPYIRRIRKHIEDGMPTIHILAAGHSNLEIAKRVAEHFQSSGDVEDIIQRTYDFPNKRSGKAICISLKNGNGCKLPTV